MIAQRGSVARDKEQAVKKKCLESEATSVADLLALVALEECCERVPEDSLAQAVLFALASVLGKVTADMMRMRQDSILQISTIVCEGAISGALRAFDDLKNESAS